MGSPVNNSRMLGQLTRDINLEEEDSGDGCVRKALQQPSSQQQPQSSKRSLSNSRLSSEKKNPNKLEIRSEERL